ncbi:hypothetical protein COT99_03110 [Candidatus Falkowbacteria bacterium CG10_big_fil_rev_8_21_14_0_10_43_10]|uniref:Kazal-like domain-containing protein n=1 Tax=Candidatus Falkowbacteria bacterium CG10_big_fil_rev_8_21_14_0_10_43_10 TaxID=1974567 RepID=A0A2H0V3L7_9BACT|nr:MAG: hypothetical protein COT99_03110 [Candidatus Falkowbacteria bacterium CG10_big_fil_rev_8_21_14_0_10_43_10]
MKKRIFIPLLLLALGGALSGCGQKKEINCEEIDYNKCGEYSEQCQVCPDGINSPRQSCHPVAFCRNFENLDGTQQ